MGRPRNKSAASERATDTAANGRGTGNGAQRGSASKWAGGSARVAHSYRRPDDDEGEGMTPEQSATYLKQEQRMMKIRAEEDDLQVEGFDGGGEGGRGGGERCECKSHPPATRPG